MAYEHSLAHGPFGYCDDPSSLKDIPSQQRQELLDKLKEEFNSKKEVFAEHFASKYGDSHTHMPIWMACETMTLGQCKTFFLGSSPKIRQLVARRLGVHDRVIPSWLTRLNTVRNICAHHGRLWNSGFGNAPLVPHDFAWTKPIQVKNNQMFCALTILKFCIEKISPESHWATRFRQLLLEFPKIPLKFMGFPDGWEKCPLW